ncbi:MAG: hypothetical protein HC831_16335 [Chloroflexia bacterium]|nr:hypothetical protein [Chloroflexia bacterium]
MSFEHKSSHRNIILSLARVCSLAMFVYFSMLVLVFINNKGLQYINTSWGYWYLLEVVGFVLVPCIVFMLAYNYRNLFLVRTAAILTMVGVILNRMNISTIAYKWYDGVIQYPTWKEVVVGVAVIFAQILVFRWIVRRMPVYRKSPSWVTGEKQEESLINSEKNEQKWKISVK